MKRMPVAFASPAESSLATVQTPRASTQTSGEQD